MTRALDSSLPGSLVLPPGHSSTEAGVSEGRLPGLDSVGEGTGGRSSPLGFQKELRAQCLWFQHRPGGSDAAARGPFPPQSMRLSREGLPGPAVASALTCMTGSPWRHPAFRSGSSLLQLSSLPFSALCVDAVTQSCPTLCDPMDCSP